MHLAVWWRSVRGWWLVAGAAATTAVATWLGRFIPGVVGGAAVAVVAAVSAVWSSRGSQLIGREAGLVLAAGEKLLRDARGRLPKVRDIDDLIAIGVHPAASADPAAAGSRVPPFVRRDRSGEIEEALRTCTFVLIVGDSTAGKSRAAIEAARAVLPDRVFIAPDPADRASVRAAIVAAERERAAVVWLDDLERYLGADGLTAHAMRALIAPGQDRAVVLLATIRAQERARYGGIAAQEDGHADQRTGRDVLALAHEIRLERRWSGEEVARAKAGTPDARIAKAIASAERYGVAEMLAAGPELMAAWQDAWAPEAGHTRGAALVAAAVDAYRAGWHQPLPTALLMRLHENYLQAHGGAALRPEPWQNAMAWATTALYATSSLLIPADPAHGALRAFDYLPDALDGDRQSTPVPEQTWVALIAEADPQTCDVIGWAAVHHTQFDVARAAFQKALDGGMLLAADGLATLLGDALHTDEAYQTLDRAVRSAAPDAEPEILIELRLALAWHTGQSGRDREALAQAETARRDAERLLGPDHDLTLRALGQQARWTGQGGDPATALRLALEAQTRWLRIGARNTDMDLNNRFEVAIWTGRTGQIAQAERLWADLDRDATRALGHDAYFTTFVRWNRAGITTETGDTTLALKLFAEVVAGWTKIFGYSHPRTCVGRLQQAGLHGETGQLDTALALASGIIADTAQALGTDHELHLAARHQRALWTFQSSRHAEAREQFTTLLAECRQALDDDHPLTENCAARLAHKDQSTWYYVPPTW